VHIVTGPVGIQGAMPGDKIAIEILDIKPLDRGFTMADTPLGFYDNVQGEETGAFGNAPEPYRAWCWWDYEPAKGGWISPSFPDVVVPYEPFPGSIGVLPGPSSIEYKLQHHADETNLYGGPAWAVSTDKAHPAAVCGEGGSHPETCLRTLAGGSYFGNTDTQRMGIGTTLYLECEVEGCGVGTGDVHGAQGDGELSITAIEMPAEVIMKLTLLKPGMPGFSKPVPSMYGTNSIKRMSPGEFISFMGFPFKEAGDVPSQYRWASTHAQALVSSKIIPESMSLATANALTKALTFLMEVGGYSMGEAMILASVTCDVKVAQLVDKPAVGMEVVVDLSIFKGAKYDAFKAAATM
jgi:formamidase